MAREIIDLTRSPSAVDRKPDVRLLQQYDRKPDIRTIPKTPLGPTKRVPATTGKKGKAVATAGKTPIERRENHVTVKKELILDNIDDAFGSLSLTTRTPAQSKPSILETLLLPRDAITVVSDSDDEPTIPARGRPITTPKSVPKPALGSHTTFKPIISSSISRTPRRKVRDPDSDSDAPSFPRDTSPTPLRRAITPPPPPSSSYPRNRQTPVRPQASRREVRKYLDLYAGAADGSSEEEDDSEEEGTRKGRDKKWRDKYYDESMGSLKDFIVPDDYESSVASDSEEVSEDEPVARKGRKRGAKEREMEAVHSDEDSDPVAIEPDEHLLHFSPPTRLLTLPDLGGITLEDSESDAERRATPTTPRRPTKVTGAPTPRTQAKTPSKKAWASERIVIAQAVFDELDRKVFDRKLGKAGAGAVLEWNNRLLTTAGTANSKWTRHSDGTRTETVKIVLSEKVLTGKEQILSTVAHEMCHLASWVISNERKNPHGRIFKSWGAKVMRARPDIEVTTKHTYEIEYKYSWKCTGAGCDKIYKRHSKSIDTTRQRCGRCKGTLEPMFEQRESSAFQVYLKAYMADAKASMPGKSHADVMRALSSRWKAGAGIEGHEVYWKSAARAARS